MKSATVIGVILFWGFGLLLHPEPARAVLGVADTVIIATDLTDAYKWPREMIQWQRIAMLLQTNNTQNQEIQRRLGLAEEAGPMGASGASSAISPVAGLLGLTRCKDAVAAVRSEDALKDRKRVAGPEFRVDSNYSLFGKERSRNSERYRSHAVENALLERLEKADENLDKVCEQELSVQRDLIKRLSRASSQSDLQALQVGMQASVQRVELARLKVQQARGETLQVRERMHLEQARAEEGRREVADAMVEVLRARALTSLHAQKDTNL